MLVFKIPDQEVKNQPIRMPWVVENIEAVFDDALQHLTDGSIIYGGALRDSIAELPLKGDLDIAVPANEYRQVLANFNNTARWISEVFEKKGDYKRPSERVIKNVSVFKSMYNKEIQLIQAHQRHEKSFACDAGVWQLVERVDIRSSGVIMNNMGEIFEVIPGAIDDCKNKRLVYNENLSTDEVFLKTMTKRVDKLTKRGWSNEIDLSRFKK